MIATVVMPMTSGPELDRCLLEQYGEQIGGHKLELFDVSRSILALDGENHELADSDSKISQIIFEVRIMS